MNNLPFFSHVLSFLAKCTGTHYKALDLLNLAIN